MEKLNNIQNLDSIIFYTGSLSTVAAESVQNREIGKEVEGLGKLTKGNNGSIYFSNYPNIKYTEKPIDFVNLNDLYSETLSYVSRTNLDFSVGYTYISQNRYHAIYTYETDLENDFDNSKIYPARDLNDFLIGLNTQKYNKENQYGNNFEVSSIKIDQTYYRWYPENTVAYVEVKEIEVPVTYTYFEKTWNEDEKYVGDLIDSEEYRALEETLDPGQYIKQVTYSYTSIEYENEDYIIGNNYYSYVRKSYDTIGNALINIINDKMESFENKYNNDPSIYAYYMYDCNSDIEMLLSTRNLGIKQSTFKIGFDSKFNNWFGNVINLNANISTNDAIAKITSSNDGEIFSIFKNAKDRISGDNVLINKDDTHEFISTEDVSSEDTINILTPYSIDTLDLSPIKTKISKNVDLTESGWLNHGNVLRSLIFDDNDNSTKSNIEKIFGLNELSNLEYLNISNIDKFDKTPAIDKLENLKVFKADGSNIDSFRPCRGNTLYSVTLPETVKSIKLVDNEFVKGNLTVAGEEVEFDGKLNYTPNSTLGNLTLRNIDNELSYKLVTDWYNALDAENKLDNSLIYLELSGIDWKDVPANTLINIKKFDINPNLSGNISIVGSGNYKWLSRKDYQDITRLYGYNAMSNNSLITSNKVFKNLVIECNKNRETFEFNLSITNENVKSFNENVAPDDFTSTKYKDTLAVKFKGYIYDNNYTSETEVSPYSNRAANALLDMIYNDGITEFEFTKDDIDNYVYCQLPRSIDTSNSNEIKNIKAGDILLFNGDTIMIFFSNFQNSNYEYIKLGSIIDENVNDYSGRIVSSIQNWFNEDAIYTLKFNPSTRPTVIQELNIELVGNHENNIIYNTDTEPFNIKVYIDDFAKEHIDEVENKEINIEYNETLLDIQSLTPTDEYKLYSVKAKEGHNFDEIVNTSISIFCDANKEDTVKSINVSLRNEFEYSSFDEETNNLLLNSNMYSYDEETQEIVINTSLVDVHYDEENQILTID